MHSPRLIPLLLISNGRLVKTRRFKDPVYVGDPLNVIRIFNEKEVDELIVLDIDASRRGTEPDFRLIEDLATQCAMPLCVGGGIQTQEHAQRIFNLGAEKVCVQSGALADPGFIRNLASDFGSQAVVASIDVLRKPFGRYQMYHAATSRHARRDWVNFMKSAVAQGAGEILLTSVNQEGSMLGADVQLIQTASRILRVPLVAHGGIGSELDVRAALAAGADAVAAGSFLVFQGPHRAVLISYPADFAVGEFGSVRNES